MSNLIDSLRDVVGSTGLITGDDVAERSDGWPPTGGCKARAILRPASTAEVSAVMRLCFENHQPIVTHGGLTGLVDGARTGSDDIVLSLERMRAIEPVDQQNRTLTVEAGVRLQTLQEVAEAAGFLFPLDLGARGTATIGGNIATNAGGNSVIRYGMAREQVLGLEAVLADGTIVSSMNTVIKNNTGYDLKHLFIGSEGTLGIVTRAVLRLRPAIRSRNTALVALQSFEDIMQLLPAMESELGGMLSAFEVMWNDFYSLVIGDGKNHGTPLSTEHPFYVLLEATGGHQEADRNRFEQALEWALENELLTDAVVAQSKQQREDLWAIRDDVEAFIQSLEPALTFDVSLGIPDMEAYVDEVREALHTQLPDSKMVVFGHIGDGNIHLVVGVDTKDSDTVHQVEEIVYRPLETRQGVVSAEHGIGLQKKAYLEISRKPEEIALMKSLKQALDPRGLLNRGKIFSTDPITP